MNKNVDILVIGAGIIGLTIALRLLSRRKDLAITIIEKEADIAFHASSRNSGVLHAGFYYTADSLKARFASIGNAEMRKFCAERNLPLNECGKLVVARNAHEVPCLYELEKRGKRNGSEIELLDAAQAELLEPNIRTFEKALWSPRTASIDPHKVCAKIAEELTASGVSILTTTAFKACEGSTVITSQGKITARKIINCAGLYADKIAHTFGFGRNYTILPFKGLYLVYAGTEKILRRNIYPVPNLKNPFLGVHFTLTVDGRTKIGPTAIPALWREQYDFRTRFKLAELLQIGSWQARLFALNSFGFRDLALEEIKKYSRAYLGEQAAQLVKHMDVSKFTGITPPGIRAQLLDTRSSALVSDFVVEGDSKSVHVLNAVSPALTCSFPFADYLIEKFVLPL